MEVMKLQNWKPDLSKTATEDNLNAYFYLREAELPKKALRAAVREFKRLKKMSPQMPEYPMLRHYLELVAELPWNKVNHEL